MLIFPFQIGSINRLKDRSVKISLITQELSAEDYGNVMTLEDYGICALKGEEGFTAEEKEALENASTKTEYGKSHSKRLRDILYVYYKKDDHGFNTFDAFYSYKMNEYVDGLLSEIDDLV